MVGSGKDVAFALAQRWNVQRNHIQAVEQIFAKVIVGQHLLKILVCGCDDAEIRLNDFGTADPFKLFILNHPQQLRLHSKGQISNLVQDRKTTMGLAMTAKVKMTRGNLDAWIGWEPVFRALLDGRPVHEPGAIVLRDLAGDALDLTRSFTFDDDREEIAHFLGEAGFLHIRNVFGEAEMAAVADDLDAALARARPDDGESWWAGDSKGVEQAVRVLWFHEKSEALDALLYDDRLQWLAELTGDGHDGSKMGAEGLVKPLDIRTGLSDLPWHKDCGQGGHSYVCCGMTVGISVTGADRRSGALGVAPGSHRANVQTAGFDPSLDIPPVKLETRTGDVTVHGSDTLHRAHQPTSRPRRDTNEMSSGLWKGRKDPARSRNSSASSSTNPQTSRKVAL